MWEMWGYPAPLFLSGGLGVGVCLIQLRLDVRGRSPRVRYSVSTGRWNSAQRARGAWWQARGNRGGCVRQEYGGRPTLDVCWRKRSWTAGRCGDADTLAPRGVRFACQAWGMVAVEGAACGSSRGTRGDERVQRAFRVAGVGKGLTWRAGSHRFAWQAQGIVRGS